MSHRSNYFHSSPSPSPTLSSTSLSLVSSIVQKMKTMMKTTTRKIVMMMMMMTMMMTSHGLMTSYENENPNYSFTYFNQMSDTKMNIFESQVINTNPYFNKLYFNFDTLELFLGGKDFLYKLDAANVSRELSRPVNLTNSFGNSIPECGQKLIRTFPAVCNNIVQSLFWRSTEKILRICTSGFGVPQEFVVNSTSMVVVNISASKDAVGKCSGIPFSNFTSIYVEDQNAIFSATPEKLDADWSYGKFPLNNNWEITRSIRSAKQPNSFEVRYVASLDIDNYIYVFLHEILPEDELIIGEEVYYTRVARVCKDDPGNKAYRYRLTSYVKTRINCRDSSGVDKMFYEVITDVHYDSKSKEFYLLISLQNEQGSAVCLLSKSTVDNTIENSPLSGLQDECWVVINDNFPPDPRPSQCTYIDTLTVGQWSYYTKYELTYGEVDSTVQTTFNNFYTRFIVERLSPQEYIYWFYSPDERGYVTRTYVFKEDLIKNRRIAKVKLFKRKGQISPLRDLRMEVINEQSYVFAVMEKMVVQLNLEMCQGHRKCTTCAVDPHCAWLTNESVCVSLKEVQGKSPTDYKSNPKAESPLDLCLETCLDKPQNVISVISGSNAAISCNSVCSPDDNSYPTWFHNGHPVFLEDEDDDDDEDDDYEFNGETNVRMMDARDYKLYILNATHDFSGNYECRDALSGKVFAAYKLNVTKFCKIEGNFESTWRGEFNNWCRSYEEYSTSYHDWKSQQCSDTKCFSKCCNP